MKAHSNVASLHTYLDAFQMDFLESYMNITLLSVSALKLAQSHLQALLSPVDKLEFVLIGDDDTYINLPGIVPAKYCVY